MLQRCLLRSIWLKPYCARPVTFAFNSAWLIYAPLPGAAGL
jgi:hypothetical protein